jgi:predicted metalloprotease
VRLSPVAVPLVAVLAVVLLLAGCTQVVPGRASAGGEADTAAIATGPVDSAAVAASTVAALQEFWREAYPAAFGRPWRDVEQFVAVATANRRAPAPPCVERAADLAGQAFYCPTADAVVWDAEGLLPQIAARFGASGVVVVLAHETGHAVQSRLGVDTAQAADPDRYPTILLEAMADCYAGVTMAHFAGRPVAGIEAVERDTALLALVGFRDPVGIGPSDASAHGNAFDRVSSFQDGWTGDAARCAGMTVADRAFTERRFGSADDRARGGNLPLERLLPAVESDARGWFTGVAAQAGWTAPALDTGYTDACPRDELAAQGPVRFCAADGSIGVDRAALGTLDRRFGDYAAATLVASRYALAALAERGAPPDGAAALCLTGAYTARLTDPAGRFTLSPGDLDEAVQVLLAYDWAARDAAGRVAEAEDGFDRVARFRAGVRNGEASCL